MCDNDCLWGESCDHRNACESRILNCVVWAERGFIAIPREFNQNHWSSFVTPIDASKLIEEKIAAASRKSVLVQRDPKCSGHASIKIASDDDPARPDLMMHISGAFDKFANLPTKDVQAIGVEIAIHGQNGLEINDPVQKYTLRSLPGKYSGLHICSIMYAAFKQFAPHEDVGIDFLKEHDAPIEMRGR